MTGRSGRVLVVEDESLVAMALEELLTLHGYQVVGPAQTTVNALELIGAEAIDAALLDVSLGGERVDTVAQALTEAAIPFVFSTGHGSASALPPAFVQQAVLRKPFKPEDLLATLDKLIPAHHPG